MHHLNADRLTSNPHDWHCRAKKQNVKNSWAWIKLIFVFFLHLFQFKPKLTASCLHHGFRIFKQSIMAPKVVQKLLSLLLFLLLLWDLLRWHSIVSKVCKHICDPLVHQFTHDCVTLFAGWSTGSLHSPHFSFSFGAYLVFCSFGNGNYWCGFKIIMPV